MEVRLPAGCDLDAARRDLRQRLPSADLQVHRWSPDGVELTLDLPAETAWKEMDGWARSAPLEAARDGTDTRQPGCKSGHGREPDAPAHAACESY